GNSVAVWSARGALPRSPVVVHVPPVACAGTDALRPAEALSLATALLVKPKTKTRPAAYGAKPINTRELRERNLEVHAVFIEVLFFCVVNSVFISKFRVSPI